MISRTNFVWPFLLAISVGCGSSPDDGSVLGTTGTDSGEGPSSSTFGSESGAPGCESVDGGGSGGGTCNSCDYSANQYGAWPMVADDEDLLDLSDVCNFSALVSSGESDQKLELDEDFNVWVYRPSSGGAWPNESAHPPIFFVPGNGQFLFAENSTPQSIEDHYYKRLFEELVADGHVVIAGQPLSSVMSSGKRVSMLACMMIWAQDATNGWGEANNDRIGLGATVMGHSRGGGAAWLLTDAFPEFQDAMISMGEYDLCSTVAIAQRWGPGGADPTPTNIPISDRDRAVPFLAIQGARDSDTVGHSIPAFDSMVPDDDADNDSQLSLNLFDKFQLWIYGADHDDFGGTIDSEPITTGSLAGPYYIASFLRWQLFKDMAARSSMMVPMAFDAQASDFPSADPDLTNSTWWSGYDQYAAAGNRPLIYADYTQRAFGSAARRFIVDSLHRPGVTTKICGGSLSPSTAGSDVTVVGLGANEVCHGPAIALTADGYGRHESHAMLVEWGGPAGEGYLEWSLVSDSGRPLVDLSQYSYLSLRLANVTDLPDLVPCTPDGDSFAVRVQIASEGGLDAVVTADVSVEQEAFDQVNFCRSNQYMRTIRFPLSSFYEAGTISTELPTALRLYFDEPGSVTHRALIDSIEFTHDPLDPEAAQAPSGVYEWSCAPDSLTAIETSCAGEPTPSCAASDVVTKAVALPKIPGTGSDGWLVHTPKGWVSDPEDLTAAELERIGGQCVAACALEWANPHVSATCSSAGAFGPPTLANVGSIGSEHRIVNGQRDGGGLSVGESLACDLETDCAREFDENVLAAALQRPTPAVAMLGRGQEYEVRLAGTTEVRFITNTGAFAMPLSGTAGYALSPNSPAQTRPFYLGGLALEGTGPLAVSGTCPDASTFSAQVDTFAIALVQPSFGVNQAGSARVAFPRGALHVEAQMVIDGKPYGVRAVNDEVVFDQADAGGIAAGAIDVDFEVPCGAAVMPVTARFRVQTADVEQHPPNVAITTPATVACTTKVALTATTGDPDGDLAALRWYVDDVLLAAGTGAIVFTEDHELRAVAYDSRGAATTATRSVVCN